MLGKLASVRKSIRQLQPTYYLPSSGPAVFPSLDESLSLGHDNIFVYQPDLVSFLADTDTRIVCMRPGQELDKCLQNPPIAPPNKGELQTLRQSLDCDFLNHRDDEFNINTLINQISLRLEKIRDLKFANCPSLVFSWGERGLHIDLNAGTVVEIAPYHYDWRMDFMCVKASPAYFSLMANPNYRWQDIYLSFRARFRREPDLFDAFINVFFQTCLISVLALKQRIVLTMSAL